jgi:hypothetical protein
MRLVSIRVHSWLKTINLNSNETHEEDETLLVQSGKPVVVFKSHKDAPKVLIANSNLVPHWATWEHFDELAAKGLIMYGQMTAGSWIYIGTQGILQGTYETFGALAKLKGWESLKGKFVLTAGLGGMGGAQPLSITMNEGVGLIVEVDKERAERRRAIGYVDTVVDTLEEAMTLVEEPCANRNPFGRAGGQRGRYLPRTGHTRHHPGCRHRPDLGPRGALLRPLRPDRRRRRPDARFRPPNLQKNGDGLHGPARSGHARFPGAGRKCLITATTCASRPTITA